MVRHCGCWTLFVALTLVFPTLTAWGGCSRSSSGTSSRAGRCGEFDNVLLVTLDTTRADRIGCYGYTAGTTPSLDAVAARGVLFEQALTQVPQTLPSHATILTGRYPRELGIRVNGQAALGEQVPTLATLFKAKGYATGAFVSSFVLDDRFGLARGFDVYDDEMRQDLAERRRIDAERAGNETTDRTLAWLGSVKARPFFCWLHYYDPHDPYSPPAAFANRGRDGYDGELAFVDSEFNRVMSWLKSEHLTERTLIVVAGDHGESFGEHGERGHAVFLYQTNMSVPMFFAHPGALPSARRVSGVSELADVFPTVLDLFGLSAPPNLLGRSLVPAMLGNPLPARPSYGESLYARYSYGWAEQRSLTTERWKFVSSTNPELFDLAADPDERVNLASRNPDIAEQLRRALMARYAAMTPVRAAETKMDDAGRRALESLGYASAGTAPTSDDFLTPNLPDPKDMNTVREGMKKVEDFMADRDFAAAIPISEEAVRTSPGSLVVQYQLGRCYVGANRPSDAIAPLMTALRLDPQYQPALLTMGEALADLNRFDEAVQHFRAAIAVDERNMQAHALLAEALRKMNRIEDAVAACRDGLRVQKDSAEVTDELGAIEESQGRLDEALRYYRRALELSPAFEKARYNAAVVLVLMGKSDAARAEIEEAVRRKPERAGVLVNRGVALSKQSRAAEAEQVFELATMIASSADEAHYNLGAMAKNAGRAVDAVKHFEALLRTTPADERGIAALSSIYVANRRSADLARILRGAHAASPQNLKFAFSLAQILSSSSDDTVRNGPEALRVAQIADRIAKHQDAEVLAVLAAAYAENSRFDEAQSTAREALSRAQSANRQGLVSQIEAQIAGYESGKPFRHPQL